MIIRSYATIVHRIEAALSQSERFSVWRRGNVRTATQAYALYCLRYMPSIRDTPLIYLSAGIHGDEPAGVACALHVMEQLAAGNSLFTQYEWVVSPCDNPFGYERDLRENETGIDLNQTFDRPEQFPQTSFIVSSLKGVHVHTAIDVHEDCDSSGFYLWERRRSSRVPIGHRIVHRVETICPINRATEIEEHKSIDGVITLVDTVGSKGWTRGRYLAECITGCCLVLETPTQLDLETRVQVHLTAIRTALEYLKRET